MKKRILYIPGLGDGYDYVRRLGLLTWRRREVDVELIPMRWRDASETFEQKLARIKQVIDRDSAPVILVGESAGGAMAIVASQRFDHHVAGTVTLCGMNQGAEDVNPHLYRRNPAFREAMEQSDLVILSMDHATKKKMMIVYSSKDFTVRPKNTLIAGVTSVDLKTFGHMTTILFVLYLRGAMILRHIRQ